MTTWERAANSTGVAVACLALGVSCSPGDESVPPVAEAGVVRRSPIVPDTVPVESSEARRRRPIERCPRCTSRRARHAL